MTRPVVKMCSGCRKTKEIVKSTRGMSYCDGCKHKAPTPAQFDSFLNEKVREHRYEEQSRSKFGSRGSYKVFLNK